MPILLAGACVISDVPICNGEFRFASAGFKRCAAGLSASVDLSLDSAVGNNMMQGY